MFTVDLTLKFSYHCIVSWFGCFGFTIDNNQLHTYIHSSLQGCEPSFIVCGKHPCNQHLTPCNKHCLQNEKMPNISFRNSTHPSSCLIGQTVVSLQQNAACLHPHSNAGTTCNSDLMYIYVQEWQIYAYAHICTVQHCPSLELFNDPIEERRAVVSYRSLLGDQHAFDRKHKRCIDQNHQSNGSNPPTFCH